MTDLPVVDAHQHFWDLERNYLPWLCDEEAIPFRYGDYSALRRNYLPRDYLRDAAGHDVVKTVYVETEWDPRDFVGETRWLQEIIAATGFPHAHRRRRAPRRPRRGSGTGRPHRLPAGARHPPQAAGGALPGRRADRRSGVHGRSGVASRLCPAREVRAVVRPADALVASCRGGRARARLSATRRSS